MRQSIRKYSWTPSWTVNLKILLDNRHPCDSHFPKGISSLSWSFLLENWNKTNVYEMITHYTSYQQCQTVSNNVNSVNSVNSVNNVNSVNSYSAVLPPSPMVFFSFLSLCTILRPIIFEDQHLCGKIRAIIYSTFFF